MKDNRFIKILALVLALAMMSVSFVACRDTVGAEDTESQTEKETLAFVPPPFDDGAKQYEPALEDIPSELGYSIIYDPGRMAYKVGICGCFLINSENKANIYFTNPDVNDVWLKLRIYNEENPSDIVCETGLLRPGETLDTVEFRRPLEDGETIMVKVMSYDPENYYSRGVVHMKPQIKNEK